MTTTDLTYAQQDALVRLGKRFRDWDRKTWRDEHGRLALLLPGDEPAPRRRRVITETGIVERVGE